jgi:hypothetical protein
MQTMQSFIPDRQQTGVDKKIWAFKTGSRNAIRYNLIGWATEEAA